MKDKANIKLEDIKKEAENRYGCIVQRSMYYITEFLSGPMCGRCFPCSMGCYEAKIRIAHIQQGEGQEEDIDFIAKISQQMYKSSLCKKGKDTALYLLEWLKSGIFQEHVNHCCGALQCPSMVQYKIIPRMCTSCGKCKDACRFGAIAGEKRKAYMAGYLPFEIMDKKCNRCGECIKVCPEDAIVLVCSE